MDENPGLKNYVKLANLCKTVIENPADFQSLLNLKSIFNGASKMLIKAAQKPAVACFYPYMKSISSNKSSFSGAEKLLIVETLNELLQKLCVESLTVYFNFYSFLLFELYDYNKHEVLSVTEEYQVAVLNCITSLIRSVSFEVIEELYVKENVPKLSQVIFVCGELAKSSKSRQIRCTAVTCIMSFAKVEDSDDIHDIVLRDKCADIFMFFLPGLSSAFSEIAQEDFKLAHKVLAMSIKAYGRILALVMQDYNHHNENPQIGEYLNEKREDVLLKKRMADKKEIDDYLSTTTRNARWYKATDEKLNITLKHYARLTHHPHFMVRLELVTMASDIVNFCLRTMPQSISTLIELLVILSQDEVIEVSSKSESVLKELSTKLSSDSLTGVMESLEDGFYNAINSLARKFNSVDDGEKISGLNLLIGYIKLFGSHNLTGVLIAPTTLQKLIESLLYAAELDRSNVTLLAEINLKDLTLEESARRPWINFRHFKDDLVKNKIEMLCTQLAQNSCFEMVYNSLSDICLYEAEHKKEAVYLLNCHISGLTDIDSDLQDLLRTVLNTYVKEIGSELQQCMDSSEYSLEEIQNNVILMSLLTEGVGEISLVMQQTFRNFLLNSLYIVLECAGSENYLIRSAGLKALHNLTSSCGYADITELVNSNFNFFSFHVERKLAKLEDKTGVLNVLSVVLNYSKKDVLVPMSNIVEEVLLQSCDRYKEKYATAYLTVFKLFIVNVCKWFNVKVEEEPPIKSRKQKEADYEDFKVSGSIDPDMGFSDDIMEGKTAEELYREDMEEKQHDEQLQEDIEDDTGYQKPEPPLHIRLTTSVLRRSLHFLSSKNTSRRLLVFEILTMGIEILRDWEDELLPVVHQIWSPLVQRFKETDPLLFRLGVQLLHVLSRLSKDFIRMRTTKEVLPCLKQTLAASASESYLKDKGSPYRYSQNYKMQRDLINRLAPILCNLDVEAKVIKAFADTVYVYLSAKQPLELQVAALGFFKTVILYDPELPIEIFQKPCEEFQDNVDRIKNMF